MVDIIYLLIAYGYMYFIDIVCADGLCHALSGHQQKKCWFSQYFLYCMCFPQMSTFNDILTLCVLMGWCLALSGHQQFWFSQYFLYCMCFPQMSTFNDILTLCVLMGWCLALSGHQQKNVGSRIFFVFPHLAIAVSPRLEVESSSHAWLDGCNFQWKQLLAPWPPRSTASATMCREFWSGRCEHRR